MLSSKHVRVFRKTCTTFWKTRTCFSKDFSYLCPMEKTKRYYEYGKFLQERFDIKYRRSPSTPASPARTETGRKDGAAVLIVITKHSVRNTAIRRKALPSN